MILREGLWKASLLGLEGGLPMKEWSEDSRTDTLVSSVLNWNLKGPSQAQVEVAGEGDNMELFSSGGPHMTLLIRYNPVSYLLLPDISVDDICTGFPGLPLLVQGFPRTRHEEAMTPENCQASF